MEIDLQQLYHSSDEFFELGGSVVMKLSTNAAVAVCESAVKHGLLIARIEGGIWHAPGFEARLDCIWDGFNPPVDLQLAEQNNREAAAFIRKESGMHDVFVLTAPSMVGW
ncbi:colicin immunity protein [Cupriavidus sp. DL-D2]|uniref:colicin immunity protein n=1 Tax=Cupriavidus sp. DL-D2 TaxID=3144974 RepID=UPI0032141B5F